MCRAQPVFWCAGGIRVDAVLHATFGAQHLGVLASLPRYSSHAALATRAGISAAHEPLWCTLFTSITRTVWVEEERINLPAPWPLLSHSASPLESGSDRKFGGLARDLVLKGRWFLEDMPPRDV